MDIQVNCLVLSAILRIQEVYIASTNISEQQSILHMQILALILWYD